MPEDRREIVTEDRRENVPEDRREGTVHGEDIGGENTAPRVVTVGILTDMNEGEEYMDMAVDLDSVPMLLEDGEGQHYVHADVVQLSQDGGGDGQKDEDTAPGEDIGGENTAPRIVTVAAVEAGTTPAPVVEAASTPATEANRVTMRCGAVENSSTRRSSLQLAPFDSTDPGTALAVPVKDQWGH